MQPESRRATAPDATEPGRADPARAAALLDAYRHGRTSAFDELIRLCDPVVRAYAQSSAWSRHDVEDIVQEVWIRLLLNAHRIEDPQTLLAWLRVVTRRVASSLGHRGARCIPAALADADLEATVSSEQLAVDAAERREQHRAVSTALARLDGADQHLLLLLHSDERPGYERISRQVNRPIGSLGPTRSRLLQRLRRDADIRRLATDPRAA